FAYDHITSHYLDLQKHFVLAFGSVNLDKITLLNIYGPSPDNPSFFTELLMHLTPFYNTHNILGGNFNLAYLGKINTRPWRVTRSHIALAEFIHEVGPVDAWRALYPNGKGYIFRSSVYLKWSRIDFIYIMTNPNLINETFASYYKHLFTKEHVNTS
uniref:Endonuclease/exonuclease/phosphatase domain-containing protein n=1 Tax=Latimeria chalumnae TaxID=7897 RepID=H3A1J4_LATCH